MFVRRWLSGLNHGSRSSASAPRPQRRRKTATKFAADVSRLEQRSLLSGVTMQPDTPNIKLKNLFYDNPSIPLHTITLYNNSNNPVYPIIYAPNSAIDNQPGKYNGKALFDVFDNPNEDYRGYVGYEVKANGKTTNYLGLPAHSQVTISVPLVFWDSGRIAVATDPTLIQTPNITFNYHTDALRYTTDSNNYRLPPDPGGIVQWYHWVGHPSQGISPAAPAQLLEVTIRDQWMTNLPNWHDISVQATIPKAFTALNYDVSYVDAMMLPAGMEAANPTIPFTGNGRKNPPDPATATRLPFGWIGANLTTDSVQQEIQKFTSNAPSAGYPSGYLGSYFGGLGYDQYYFPPSLANAGINIPAGNHLFADASVNDTPSPYDVNQYMLASGGGVYHPQPNVGMPGTTVQGQDTMTGLDPALVAQLAPGMLIKDNSGPNSPILQSTTVKAIVNATTIEMSNPTFNVASSSTTRNYTFDGSQFTGMLHTATGDTTMLIPSDPSFLARLLAGMLVSGPAGIPAGTRILKITGTAVVLTNPVPASTGDNYTFSGGISDPYTTDLANLWYGWAEYYVASHPGTPDVPFSSQVSPLALSFPASEQTFAGQFAAEVYDVMINFSKIPVIDNRLSGSTQLMENIIGDNVGMIPNLPPAQETQITNEVISLMRGVLDYTDPNSVSNWYSAPTDTTQYGGAMIGGVPASFNVYNLNPYVWFVHSKLGLTGYAFSVDDGISDVDSYNATQLLITIGPITSSNNPNLPNTLKYGNTTPWGPVMLQAKQKNTTTLQLTNPKGFYKLGQINGGATVASTGGDASSKPKVLGVNNLQYWVNLKPPGLTPSTTTNTYTFYDPGINGPL